MRQGDIRMEVNKTHHTNVVEETVLHQRIRQTLVVALPMLRVALAHRAEYPGEIHPRTATREHQVVVELIFLGCRTIKSCTLDTENDGIVVRSQEHLSSESVCSIFPTKWKTLSAIRYSESTQLRGNSLTTFH